MRNGELQRWSSSNPFRVSIFASQAPAIRPHPQERLREPLVKAEAQIPLASALAPKRHDDQIAPSSPTSAIAIIAVDHVRGTSVDVLIAAAGTLGAVLDLARVNGRLTEHGNGMHAISAGLRLSVH
jgi:hypothetical protein